MNCYVSPTEDKTENASVLHHTKVKGYSCCTMLFLLWRVLVSLLYPCCHRKMAALCTSSSLSAWATATGTDLGPVACGITN